MTLDERLQQQVAHAYANAPATRARFDAAGVDPALIRTVADLIRLPVLPKDAVVQMQQNDPPFGGLLAVPLSAVRHIFFSPGPLYEPDGADDDDTTLRMAVHALRAGGFAPGDVVLNTLSYHLVPAGLLLDMALTALGCTVVPAGFGNSDLQVKLMADLGVTGYAGTPSYLVSLLEKAAGMGLTVGNGLQLRKALVTAEPLPPNLRQRLTGDYRLHVCNAYGTAELGLLAINTDGSMAMRLLPEPLIEVVDPETGEPVAAGAVGEVVVTNFSRAYPLLRLGTGDMAVNFDPAPGQSAQAERAIALVGRRGEAVKVRGMFVHPNQLRFGAGPVLRHAGIQGVVTRRDNRDWFTVRVVSTETDKVDALQEALRQVCRVRVDAVEFVDALPADAPGMVDARDWA